MAKANLESTKVHYEQAKAQMQSAKTVYESAKTLYEKLKSKETKSTLMGEHGTFCTQCIQISFDTLFLRKEPVRAGRRRFGQVSHVLTNKDRCQFCEFLFQACLLGIDPRQQDPTTWLSSKEDESLYWVTKTRSTHWYRTAGIDATLVPCRFAWLQVGAATQTGEPHICITFDTSDIVEKGDEKEDRRALPKPRERTEAADGILNYASVEAWLKICGDPQDNSRLSRRLETQDCKADFLLIKRWPRIRDSEASNKWRYDMVSALLILKGQEDETYERLAAVLIEWDQWLAMNPRPVTVDLI